jgi:hypothetical protein
MTTPSTASRVRRLHLDRPEVREILVGTNRCSELPSFQSATMRCGITSVWPGEIGYRLRMASARSLLATHSFGGMSEKTENTTVRQARTVRDPSSTLAHRVRSIRSPWRFATLIRE